MKSLSGKDVAELVGITAIVASLIFVGLQLRQDRDVATAQLWSNNDQLVVGLSELVSENREIWIKGLHGEELSDVDRVAFQSIAMAVIRRYSNQSQRAQALYSERRRKMIAEELAFQLYQYPGLRRVFEEIASGRRMTSSAFGRPGNPPFLVAVEDAVAGLDRTSPPIPEPTYTPY